VLVVMLCLPVVPVLRQEAVLCVFQVAVATLGQAAQCRLHRQTLRARDLAELLHYALEALRHLRVALCCKQVLLLRVVPVIFLLQLAALEAVLVATLLSSLVQHLRHLHKGAG
jgi:hypothetical protein